MRNKVFILVRTLIRNGEGFSSNEKMNKVALLIGTLFLMGIGVAIGSFINSMYNGLVEISQTGLIVSLGLSLGTLILFVFGIIHILTSLFMSQDIEFLMPLPLKEKQILAGKFLVVYLYQLLFAATLLIPELLVFGTRGGLGVGYYVLSLLVVLFFPMMPLSVGGAMVMVIMRFANASRYKDLLKVLGGILATAVGLGINLFIQSRFADLSEEELLALLARGEDSLVPLTSTIFPGLRFGITALLSSDTFLGFVHGLAFVFAGLLAFYLLLVLGQFLYLKAVIGMNETGAKRKTLSEDSLASKLKRRPVLVALVQEELKLLIRTPIYFLNCVMPMLIWPFFSLVMLATQDIQNDVQGFLSMIGDPSSHGKILIGAMALSLFIGGANGISSTAISREGEMLSFKKSLAVPYSLQLLSKILTGFLPSALGFLLLSLIFVFLLELPLPLGLLLLFLCLLPLWFINTVGLLLDIYNPKLKWDSEQKAVKQNLNVIYSLLISLLFGGLTIYGGFALDLSLGSAAIAIFFFFGLANLLSGYFLFTEGVERFLHLEG